METDEPVFDGYLILPPSGKILKKAWQKKYCVLYKRSSSGIARIEIFENEAKTGQAKIITLEDVIKITPKSSNVINVVTKNSDMEFGTMSSENLNNWFGAFKCVAFPEDSTWINSIEQDNDLYCSADEGVFCVKLHPSDASQRCNLASINYILVVTASAIQLRNEGDNRLLYTWPFSFIRKYGYKSGKFTFEAGRKCASGEGVFYLEHPNHNEIYRCLSTRMKNMRKLLNGESTSSLIDCGDMQLHAALSMEAGSRSPLPVSLSTQSSFEESNKASLGLNFPSSMSSVESLFKSVPKKPPRKSLPPKNLIQSPTSAVTLNLNAVPEYADINVDESDPRKYDSVESRKDAWKTMGVQEPTHFELSSTDLEDIYSSWGNGVLKKYFSENKLGEKSFAAAVIKESATSPTSQYYDCLQHFGSSSALNVSSGCKKRTPQVNRSIENLGYSEESFFDDDRSLKHSQSLSKSVSEIKLTEKTHAPTVISEPMQFSDEQGYDHLNFFGQSSALTTSSDYKQVKSSATAPPPESTCNLYEEVNVMESARSADDSHSGYGLIKKDKCGDALKEVKDDSRKQPFEEEKEEPQRVSHQFQNHQPYAVINESGICLFRDDNRITVWSQTVRGER